MHHGAEPSWGLFFCTLAAAVALEWGDIWGIALGLWIAMPPLAGAVLGYAAGHQFHPLKRWLIPPAIFQERVQLAATHAFLHEEVLPPGDAPAF